MDGKEAYIKELERILELTLSHLNTLRNYEFTKDEKERIQEVVDSFSAKLDLI